jgi:hypothetical protein
MATQSVPNIYTLSNTAAASAVRRRVASRRFPSPPIVGASRRREEKQVQQRQKLLVDPQLKGEEREFNGVESPPRHQLEFLPGRKRRQRGGIFHGYVVRQRPAA